MVFPSLVTLTPFTFYRVVNNDMIGCYSDESGHAFILNKILKVTFWPQRWQRDIFKNYISITWQTFVVIYCYYSPLSAVVTLYINIFESPLLRDTLCQVWLKLSQLWCPHILKKFQVYCRYTCPSERTKNFLSFEI